MFRLKPILLLTSAVASLAYLVFRAIFTLNMESVWAQCFSIIVLLAECQGIFLMLLYYWEIRDTRPASAVPAIVGRTVDVFMPTYDEDVHLLRGSIQSYVALDYPCQIYVLDDGNRLAVKTLCEEMGVQYIARKDNLHAKAGNINHALEMTSGEFVVIFDSDHIARPHFISRTIGHFADERVGWVQTPHAFYNFDSFSSLYRPDKNVYWEEGDLFYRCIQLGKSNANAVVFCGSAAIMRRKALEDVGLIATETITEDMHTGLRMHARGWKSVFVPERLIAAQAASEVTTYQSQRLRWGEGNLSIIKHDNPLTMRGLTLGQRVHYLTSMLGWSSGIGKLVLYATPIFMLFTGIAPLANASAAFILMLLAHLLLSAITLKATGMGSFRIINNELSSMATYWTQVRCVYRALTRSTSKFVVTKKRGRQSTHVLPLVMPQLILIILGVTSITWASGRLICGVDQNYFALWIGSGLIIFQSSLAWCVLRRALGGTDRRFSYRHQQGIIHAVIAPESPQNEPSEIHAMCFDINETGVRILCYQELSIGQPVRLELHASARKINSQAVVTWQRPATLRPAVQAGTASAFYVGLKFLSPDPATLNALWELSLEHVVAGSYDNMRFAGSLAQHDTSVQLPVIVTRRSPAGHAQRWYCVLTDFDKLKLLITGNVPDAGEEHLSFELITPVGPIRGIGHTRTENAQRNAPFTQVLTVDKFDEQGRGRLNSLRQFNAKSEHSPQVRLTPRAQRRRFRKSTVTMFGWTTLTLSIVVPIFGFWYQQQIYLIRLASSAELSEEQKTFVSSMVEATQAGEFSNLGQLQLLLEVLEKHGRAEDRAAVADAASRIAPENEGYLLAAIDARIDSAGPDAALDLCLTRIGKPEKAGTQLLLRAIRCAGDCSRTDQVVEYLHDLVRRESLTAVEAEECVGHSLASKETKLARLFLAMLDQSSAAPRGLRTHALVALADSDYQRTEALCDEIVSRDGQSEEMLLFAGDCYYWSSCFSKAADVWVRAAKLTPLTNDAEERLADALLQSGKYVDALAFCRKCADPKYRSRFRTTVALELLTLPDLKTLVPDLNDADLQLKKSLMLSALEERVASERLIWAVCSAERTTAPALLVQFLQLNHEQILGNADLMIQLANALFAIGEYGQVISVLEDMENRRLAPIAGGDDVKLLRARSLVGLLRSTEAGEILRDALAGKPGDVSLSNETAGVLLTAGNRQQALEVMRGVVDASKTEESAMMMISVLSANEKWDELLQFLPSVKVSNKIAAELRIAEAQALFATRKFADAVGVLRRLLPTVAEGANRQNVELLLSRGLVWNQQFDDAAAILVTLPEQMKSPDNEHLVEAVLSAILGQLKPHPELETRAFKIMKRLRLEGPSEKLQLLACDVMLKLQRAEDVIDWLAGGVKADDLSSAQQIRLANAFEITKQYQLALSYYEKLLKEEGKTVEHEQLRHADDEPASPEMTFNREELLLAAARCAVNARNLPLGVQYFEVLVREFACKPDILCEYSGLLLQQGKVKDALENMPDSAILTSAQRILMIDVMIADNKLDEAKNLAESMASDPVRRVQGELQLLEKLAVIEQIRGNYRAAAGYYQQLLDLDESAPKIRASLAQQQVLSSNLPAALENYRWLVEKEQLPESEWYWLLVSLSGNPSLPDWSRKTLDEIGRRVLADPLFPVRDTEQLAFVQIRTGNKPSALRLIELVLAKPNVNREDLLLLASNLAAELGDFITSESYLERLIKLRKLKTGKQLPVRGVQSGIPQGTQQQSPRSGKP